MNWDIDISTIASGGAMAVSIYCIFKVYNLLEKEQAQQRPRKSFLKAINQFKVFAIVMTLLALGIEVSKHFMDETVKKLETDYAEVKTRLIDLQESNYYSVDSKGNPISLKIKYDTTEILLSKAFPVDKFQDTPLYLKKDDDPSKIYAYKNNGVGKITLGQISTKDLKPFTKHLFEEEDKKSINAKDYLLLGMHYTPKEVIGKTNIKTPGKIEKKTLAIENLINAICLPYDADYEEERKNALKLLIQPGLMDELQPSQSQKVIHILEDSTHLIQKDPWRLYSLAQVYSSRFNNNGTKEEDQNKKLEYYCKYRRNFEGHTKLNSTKLDSTGKVVYKFPIEKGWYDEAVNTLNASNEFNCE